MRLPADEIGARAAEYLLGRVDGQPVVALTEVQVSLIVRGSTAPPSRLSQQRKLEQAT